MAQVTKEKKQIGRKELDTNRNSPAHKKWIERLSSRFESKSANLIPVLQFIQSQEGYLCPEGMQAAAKFLRIDEAKVYGVASFYAQFYFEPRGKNKLTICRGTACHVRGSGRLLSEVERNLGVKPGETTEDLSFSLETVACFGACALAPVVVINEQVHRQQTPAALTQTVNNIRFQSSSKKGGQKRGTTKKRGTKKGRS